MTSSTPELTTDPKRPERANIYRRISEAWLVMRRCASTPSVKEALYGSGADALDSAVADALLLIARNGPLRMGELAELMHITPASATRVAGCLVDKGLVVRDRATQDQRTIVVSATDEGRVTYHQIRNRHITAMDRMLSNFSEEEEDLLVHFLERFTSGLGELMSETETGQHQPDL